MPDYEIRCTADNNKVWPIGPNLPDKQVALHIHNYTDAKTKGIGSFTFDDTHAPTDYYLTERASPGGQEITFALYQANPSD